MGCIVQLNKNKKNKNELKIGITTKSQKQRKLYRWTIVVNNVIYKPVYHYIAAHLVTYCDHQENRHMALGLRWYELEECPEWYDEHTRGCPYPNGVIIAGSSQVGHGMKVKLIDLSNPKQNQNLPDLEFPVTDVGMTYDSDTGLLTVAGGHQYDKKGGKKTTNSVFQLYVPNIGAKWDKLPVLPFVVTDPMLVNDDEYLYVLGGDTNGTANLGCVRKSKTDREDQWFHIERLPTVDGVSMEHQYYYGGKYAGALWYDKNVRVLTRSECLTYDSAGNTWDRNRKSYSDTSIRHLTPILHKQSIVASIQRKDNPTTTIERFDINAGNWINAARPIITPHESGIGAGRIISVQKNLNF